MRKKTFCRSRDLEDFCDAHWKDTREDFDRYAALWDHYYGIANGYDEYQKGRRGL